MLARDSIAEVLDLDGHLVLDHACPDLHLSGGPAVLHGVGDQIPDRLFQQRASALHPGIPFDLDDDLRPGRRARVVGGGGARHRIDHRFDDGGDGNRLELQDGAAFGILDPGECEEILDDVREPLPVADDDVAALSNQRGIIRLLQQFRITVDRRDRRAELVRDVRGEVRPNPFELSQAGDLLEQDHRADDHATTVGERFRHQFGDPRRPRERDLRHVADARFQRGLDRILKGGLADHLLEQAASDLDVREFEHPERRGVEPNDPLFPVEGDQAVRHRLQDREHLRGLDLEGVDARVEFAGHRVERDGEFAEFVGSVLPKPAREVAVGESTGGIRRAAGLATDRSRERREDQDRRHRNRCDDHGHQEGRP